MFMTGPIRNARSQERSVSRFLRLLLSLSFLLGVVSLDREEAASCHDHEPLQTTASCEACWISAAHNGTAPPGYVTLSAPVVSAFIPEGISREDCSTFSPGSLLRLRAPPAA